MSTCNVLFIFAICSGPVNIVVDLHSTIPKTSKHIGSNKTKHLNHSEHSIDYVYSSTCQTTIYPEPDFINTYRLYFIYVQEWLIHGPASPSLSLQLPLQVQCHLAVYLGDDSSGAALSHRSAPNAHCWFKFNLSHTYQLYNWDHHG